jgi:MYXO-CTERM domain-containing protein
MSRTSLCGAALALGLFASHAGAQVTEPNGQRVPNLPSTNGETSIQDYFDDEGENIDALVEASAEPGAFSPLCDFTAKVVLAEAMSADGLAWYNVPADPTSRPTALYQIVPETTRVTGAVFSGADIRTNPNYAGGLIGFALTQDDGTGSGSKAIYYSEYRRNANCTGCINPGYWKMMLAYRSKLHQSSYYLGFEDWPGANASSWGDNDGDFQDKLFLVTGVSCPGGGEPCDTGQQGLCAAGLTECAVNGKPVCKPQNTPQGEKCDNVDNDCNGQVDDGNLCDPGKVCVRGQCVGKCNTGEFSCVQPLVCGDDGFCIDPACKTVTCPMGLACRDGKCVGACQGVTCPLGQVCRLDRCVDPCAGVVCPAQTYCERGVCVGDCACNGCPTGEECAKDGRCTPPGCAAVTCPATQACKDGQCVPACTGAVCPGGAACQDGVCANPPTTTAGGAGGMGGGSSTGGGISIVTGGVTATTGGTTPSTSGGSASTTGGTASAGSPGGGLSSGGSSGSSCACRTAGTSSETPGVAGLFAAALALSLANRRRARGRA